MQKKTMRKYLKKPKEYYRGYKTLAKTNGFLRNIYIRGHARLISSVGILPF